MVSEDINAVEYATLDGARIAYRISGKGPAIVLIKNGRRPLDFPAAAMLSAQFCVVQIHPVGFGASDRPADYLFGSVSRQVLQVLDNEDIDRFAVWGFSQTAAMAAMVARSTSRAAALIGGGFPLIGYPNDAEMRRMEREPRLPRPSLEFWRAYRALDWHRELQVHDGPKLVYFGSEDRKWAQRVRRLEPFLKACGCDYLEFDDLDHQTCGLGDSSSGSRRVSEAVTEWLGQSLPNGW